MSAPDPLDELPADRPSPSVRITLRYVRASACDDAGELAEAVNDEFLLEAQELAEQKAWKERGAINSNDDENEKGGADDQGQ